MALWENNKIIVYIITSSLSRKLLRKYCNNQLVSTFDQNTCQQLRTMLPVYIIRQHLNEFPLLSINCHLTAFHSSCLAVTRGMSIAKHLVIFAIYFFTAQNLHPKVLASPQKVV